MIDPRQQRAQHAPREPAAPDVQRACEIYEHRSLAIVGDHQYVATAAKIQVHDPVLMKLIHARPKLVVEHPAKQRRLALAKVCALNVLENKSVGVEPPEEPRRNGTVPQALIDRGLVPEQKATKRPAVDRVTGSHVLDH